MLTVLGGLAEFERELTRARTGEGRARRRAGFEDGAQAETHPAPGERGDQAARQRRGDTENCTPLQRIAQHTFEVERVKSFLGVDGLSLNRKHGDNLHRSFAT